jgi:hypothetical protein
VEVHRVAYEEKMASGAPMWEKMMEAPALMGAAGANVSPCNNCGCLKMPRSLNSRDFKRTWLQIVPGGRFG